ncbi:MAG: ATP-binding protein [Pyrinomonadaceae bacterium]
MTFTANQQSAGLFKDIFALFGTISPNGSILSLSGNIFKNTEIEPNVLIGQKFSDAVFWQTSGQNVEQINKALKEASLGNQFNTLLSFRVNSTLKKLVELNFYPVSNESEIFFCAQDVTQREKEIEFYKLRSEQMLYAAESANIGLWFWDVLEDKIFSTPRFNDFFEVPAHELIGLDSFFKILHPDDRERVEMAFQESQVSGKEYKQEFRVINSDGNTHWLSAHGKSFLDSEGNPVSMMGVLRKITDRKIADEELSIIFEREKKARDESEEANRAKDFFLAFVSHELRSPLNAILGWTKILLTKEVDKDVTKNALETIERSARSQSKLINDLVDSARVASGKLRLELTPVNFHDVIKNVYNSHKPQADSKHINLNFSSNNENISVVGDSVRLQQVFTNLLSNSLKFTPEGGNIDINVEARVEDVKVSICDNGLGISTDALPKIFNQFSQGDSDNHDRTGLGLGLSIVKTLVGKHGGKVAAQSDGLGKGATFSVSFPLSTTTVKPSEEKSNGAGSGKPLKGKKILIVEDDPDSCEVLDLFLEQSGAEVVQSNSASEAMATLKNLKNHLPDVIISDLGMSEEDGYSLMSRIRAMNKDEGGNIPAIALSAFTSQDNKKKAFQVGFQKYHTKPFEPDMLIDEVLELLK